MYELVADIARYPEFLRWCSEAKIIDESEHEVVASVTIDYKGINKTLITRNHMHPHRKIEMSKVAGPFRHLSGVWVFTSLGENASKIELNMAFDFENKVVEKLIGPVFSYIANHQVDAFTDRARIVHGG